MACNSLLTFSNDCGESVTGGIKSLHLIAEKDLKQVSSGSTEFYSESVEGVINAFGFVSASTKFVKVEFLKENPELKEDATFDKTKGSKDIQHTLTFPIHNLTPSSRKFINSLAGQKLAAIVGLRSGWYVLVGANGYFTLTSVSASSGVAASDMNGYTVTLSGSASEFAKLVDKALVPTFVDAL